MRDLKFHQTVNYRSGYNSPQARDVPVMWTDTILRESEAVCDHVLYDMPMMDSCEFNCPFNDCHQRLKECPVNAAGYVTEAGNFRRTKGVRVLPLELDEFSPEAKKEHDLLKIERDILINKLLSEGKKSSEDYMYKQLTGRMYRLRLKEGRKRA